MCQLFAKLAPPIIMIKHLLLFSLLLTTALLFSACKQGGGSSDKIKIVTVSFSEHDWLMNIIGDEADRFEVTRLIGENEDLHSYSPSVADIANIASAQLLIHNGGSSDAWISDVQRQVDNKKRSTVSLMKTLQQSGAKPLGSSCSHEHHHHHGESCQSCAGCSAGCTHEHHAAPSNSDLAAGDEHVWLSLNNAIIICERLEDELSAIDPERADVYEKNKQIYIASLKQLHERYAALFKEAKRDTVIIADRFPFRYMLHDYGIKYVAAFDGCSADTSASFEAVAELSEKVRQLDAHTIIVLQNGLRELAETVIKTSGQPNVSIETLHPLDPIEDNSASYYGLMEKNLQSILKALQD